MSETVKISRKTQWWLYLISLAGNDVIMMIIAFQLSYLIRFRVNIPFFSLDAMTSYPYYSGLIILLIPFWLAVFKLAGLYDKQHLLGGPEEYQLVFRSTTIGMFMVIVAGFLRPDFIVARGWLILAWLSSFFFIAVGRLIQRRVVYYARRHGYFLSPTLIVGANDEGILLAKQLMGWQNSGLNVLGFVDKKIHPGKAVFDQVRVLGNLDNLHEVIDDYGIEEVILATSAISSRDKMLEIFKRYGISETVNVRLSSGLYEIITTGLTVKEFAYVPLVCVNKVRLTGIDIVLKAMLDYAITIPALIFLAPVMIAIAVAIKLDSPGPIIYRRRVMGVNNTQFDAYKFRTMLENGDEILEQYPDLKKEWEENQKLKDDPRVTKLGNFLRKYSLDELPQLFNVLKREMSLVGPRMISPPEMAKYNQWGLNLLTISPGLTGLWQVSGRSDVSYDERVRLDMHYIRNWSIWLDMQLIFWTIPAVIKGRGAY